MISDRVATALQMAAGYVHVPPSFIHEPVGNKPVRPDYEAATVFTAVAATDLLTSTGHGLVEGRKIRVSSDTTLPAGLVAATDYYVIASGLTANDFKVSATPGGTAVDVTDAGTGIHSWVRYLDPVEQSEVDNWLGFYNGVSGPVPALPTQSAAVLMLADIDAYHLTPAFKNWWNDDQFARKMLYLLRGVDIATASEATVSPSAIDTGVGSGAATAPIATLPSPTECESVQVSYTGILGGTITLEMTCPTPGSTIHYRRPSGSGAWNIYGGPVGMTASQVAEFYASAPGLTDSSTDTFDNS